jgi:hypothetical protein
MVTAVPARWRGRLRPLLGAARVGGAWLAVAAATLKVVPVVGHTAAVPFDTCADVID